MWCWIPPKAGLTPRGFPHNPCASACSREQADRLFTESLGLALACPFALPRAFSLSGIAAVEPLLEVVELPRAGLDPQVLGNDAPASALVGPVLPECDLLGLPEMSPSGR